MHVSPILSFSPDQIKMLIPLPNGNRINSLVDLIPKPVQQKGQFPLVDIMTFKFEMEAMWLNFNKSVGIDADTGDNYERYLQFYNAGISSVAKSIVKPSDTNDEKMYKIEQWVINNIEYKLDRENYGMLEYWALPVLTLARGTGDCEDGAFLLHSLALHAGVPIDDLRTYGGFVEIEEGIPLMGGHAWTAYQRESDGEWVEMDWCYYATDEDLATRTPMKNDTKYWDDFFYVDALKTVDGTFTNRIRKPDTGSFVNVYA